MPPQELSFGNWNSDTQDSTNISIDGDTFTLASEIPDSGLLHDYNALNISTSDGNTVSSWADSHGSNDLAGGAPTYRASGINGQPALEFDTTDDDFTGNPFTHGDSGAEYTFHIVYEWTPSSDINTVFGSGDGDGINYRIRGDQNDEREVGLTGVAGDPDGTATTSPEVVSVRRSAANGHDMLVNGSSVSLGASDTPNQATGAAYVGSFDGSSRWWNDLLGRLLWYDQEQSSTDFQNTHDTLRSEWGV